MYNVTVRIDRISGLFYNLRFYPLALENVRGSMERKKKKKRNGGKTNIDERRFSKDSKFLSLYLSHIWLCFPLSYCSLFFFKFDLI